MTVDMFRQHHIEARMTNLLNLAIELFKAKLINKNNKI